jgi:glycosyltransferase involved in cell wall biosynthesis
VVASHNAQSTLEDCLASLTKLQYPDFEVIVVDDGSTDETAAIARRFPFKLISIPKGGLSVARNVGLRAATGEVVAYTDSDCRVDPHWLSYLVLPFLNSDMVGVGGPNLVPPDDPWMAHCVARSPGGPLHVLLTDSIAEHIPGCNMAFRKWALEEIEGFDPAFVKAGDDVDVCWRLQERGYRLGFSHAALVWHHHRDHVRAYWRQQVGYGEGEAFLERKHPNKFKSFGPEHWQGSLYSPLPAYRALTTQRIYHGLWGGAAFPSVCHRPSGYLTHLPQSIEWQLTMMMIALYSVFNPWLLLMALTGFALTLGCCLAHAAATDLEACPPIAGVPRRLNRPLQRAVITFLHFIQPLARIRGRLKGKLRSEPKRSASVPLSRELASLLRWGTIKAFFSEDVSMYWSTNAVETQAFLSNLVHRLSGQSVAVTLDDGWQEWDLVARSRPFVEARIKAVSENYGGRKRLLRVATKLRIKRASWCAFMVLIAALVYLTRSNDGHRLGLELSLFWVSNLLVLWYGARLLAKVSRASDEVAEGITMTKFRERRTVSDPVAERSNIEHKTVR